MILSQFQFISHIHVCTSYQHIHVCTLGADNHFMWWKKITSIYYMSLKYYIVSFRCSVIICLHTLCWGYLWLHTVEAQSCRHWPGSQGKSHFLHVSWQVRFQQYVNKCLSFHYVAVPTVALSLTTFFPCRGQILCSLGDHLTPQLPTCLPIFLDRLRNEITRLTTVKAYTLIAGWELNYSNLHVGSNKQKTQKDIPFFPGPLSVNPTLKGKRLGNP